MQRQRDNPKDDRRTKRYGRYECPEQILNECANLNECWNVTYWDFWLEAQAERYDPVMLSFPSLSSTSLLPPSSPLSFIYIFVRLFSASFLPPFSIHLPWKLSRFRFLSFLFFILLFSISCHCVSCCLIFAQLPYSLVKFLLALFLKISHSWTQ